MPYLSLLLRGGCGFIVRRHGKTERGRKITTITAVYTPNKQQKARAVVIYISVISLISRDFCDIQPWPISMISVIFGATEKTESLMCACWPCLWFGIADESFCTLRLT